MMPASTQDALALVGRTLLALMFVIAGYSKIGGFAGTVAYVASKGLPAAQVVSVLTIVLELGAGLALIVGLHARWAALALAVFTLAAAFLFHDFWAVPPEQQLTQYLSFMKNISITGGLLAITAFGPGGWSWDERRKAEPSLRTARP
jgi:putative oxidoreductase